MKSIYSRLKLKPILALVVLLTWHTSCNDWVDIQPENELIKQDFWKTSDDVMSVMAAAYDALRETTIESFLLGEVRADFLYVTGTWTDYARIGVSDINSTNDKVKWQEYYNTINLANTVMYYAPLVQELDQTLTDEVIDDMASQMLFLRSLSYFYLVRLWKDVPLVLFPTISDTVDFYIAKSPEHVVLNQIEKDLKKASALASPDLNLGDAIPYMGRCNKYAIQALLADVLLWQEDYNQALSYCDSIVESNLFGLENINDFFDIYYPGNSPVEAIFEIQYDDKIEGQENPMYDDLLGRLRVYATALALYDEDNDLRFFDGEAPVWKYIGQDETGSGTRERTSSERDANFIYYRYAEVLLMKAEALMETGNFEEANYQLRLVSERAGITHTDTYNRDSFLKALLNERGREFGAEGKRWFDLLRFAKKNNFEKKQDLVDVLLSKASDANELAIMRTRVIDTMSYYLPIFEDEIQYNKNLVQNPFYDR